MAVAVFDSKTLGLVKVPPCTTPGRNGESRRYDTCPMVAAEKPPEGLTLGFLSSRAFIAAANSSFWRLTCPVTLPLENIGESRALSKLGVTKEPTAAAVGDFFLLATLRIGTSAVPPVSLSLLYASTRPSFSSTLRDTSGGGAPLRSTAPMAVKG